MCEKYEIQIYFYLLTTGCTLIITVLRIIVKPFLNQYLDGYWSKYWCEFSIVSPLKSPPTIQENDFRNRTYVGTRTQSLCHVFSLVNKGTEKQKMRSPSCTNNLPTIACYHIHQIVSRIYFMPSLNIVPIQYLLWTIPTIRHNAVRCGVIIEENSSTLLSFSIVWKRTKCKTRLQTHTINQGLKMSSVSYLDSFPKQFASRFLKCINSNSCQL